MSFFTHRRDEMDRSSPKEDPTTEDLQRRVKYPQSVVSNLTRELQDLRAYSRNHTHIDHGICGA